MTIESSAFKNGDTIPAEYTCDGAGINPPLAFSDIPARAQSLMLIVDDPDAPSGDFVHWIVWNISPQITHIAEGTTPPEAIVGRNSIVQAKYQSPCPPSGIHRYFFKLYALDTMLELTSNAGKPEAVKMIEGHIIEKAELVGKYGRS